MTATAQRFTVGQEIRHEAYEQLPLGATVHFNSWRPGMDDDGGFVKRSDGWRRIYQDGTEEEFTESVSLASTRILRSLPDEPQHSFAVGQVIDSAEQRAALPVGTLLTYNPPEEGRGWRKADGGWYEIRDGEQASVAQTMPPNVPRRILELPTDPTAGAQIQVGATLTGEMIERLPEGTRIRFNYSGDQATALLDGEQWIRRGTGWRSEEGAARRMDPEHLSRGRWFVSYLPGTQFTVGQALNSNDEFDALPDGSIIISTTNERFAKRNGEWFRDVAEDGGGGERYRGNFSLRGYNRIERIGALSFSRGHMLTAEEFDALPVGTIVRDTGARYEESGTDHTKQPDGQWSARGTRTDYTGIIREMCRNQPGSIRYWAAPTGTTAPPAPVGDPAAAAAVVEACKTEVRQAINNCVRDQGGWWEWVAQGAFILLGVESVPQLDATLPIGSAFGLPVGSVVRYNGTLYRVDDNRASLPNAIAGRSCNYNRDTDRTDWMRPAQIVFLGEHAEPVYTGRNNFLHTVWEKQRELRMLHSWCRAVEACLNSHNLPDPGNIPDAPALPPFAVGDVVRLEVDSARMGQLPVGTTFELVHNGRMVIKSQRRYALVDTLNEVAQDVDMRITNIITAIPETELPF